MSTPTTNNKQYRFPNQRGDYNIAQPVRYEAVQDTRTAQDVTTRLKLQEIIRTDPVTAKITIETNAAVHDTVVHATPHAQQLTFADIEPFLFHVGDWLEFDRREIENNGRIR
jgi:hypothetical protein